MQRTYKIQLEETVYEARAEVYAPTRGTGEGWTAAISSVCEAGVELPDEVFEPLASQLEEAVIEAHRTQIANEREARLSA